MVLLFIAGALQLQQLLDGLPQLLQLRQRPAPEANGSEQTALVIVWGSLFFEDPQNGGVGAFF